jgi:hypothetical protein
MPPTAELAGAAMGSAAVNGGACVQRLANPGNSLLMPVMMKFTPIAATIRAITRVMTLMPVLPKNRSIRAAIHNVSPIKKVASTDTLPQAMLWQAIPGCR